MMPSGATLRAGLRISVGITADEERVETIGVALCRIWPMSCLAE